MLLLNFAFENTFNSFKPRLSNNAVNFKSNDDSSNTKLFGFIIKISVISAANPFFIYMILPENFAPFLINSTADFSNELNNKNVVHKFCDTFLIELKKLPALDSSKKIKFKIAQITLGSITLDERLTVYSSNFKISGIYEDTYFLAVAKPLTGYIKELFFLDYNYTVPQFNIETLFNDTNNAHTQMLLNILLRSGVTTFQLAQIFFCFPALAKKILTNISKKNKLSAIAQFEKLKAEPPDKNLLINEINTNIIPLLINAIDKNNITVYSYIKIKNLNEIYEYYKFKHFFLECPFEKWLKIILHSKNKREYQNELLKKEFFIGFIDIDSNIISSIFDNLSTRALNALLEDIICFKKNNTGIIQIFKTRNKIVELIKLYEISEDQIKLAISKLTELLKESTDSRAVQIIIQNANQQDLFLSLKYLNNSIIEQNFFSCFSKNTKKDYLDFNVSAYSNYKIYKAVNNMFSLYVSLFESGKLKKILQV